MKNGDHAIKIHFDSPGGNIALPNLRFELDKTKLDQYNKNNRGSTFWQNLSQYASFFWTKLGLGHILLILLLAAYACFGGVVFYAIEGPNERQGVVENNQLIMEAIARTSADILAKVLERSKQEMQVNEIKSNAFSLTPPPSYVLNLTYCMYYLIIAFAKTAFLKDSF